MKRCLLFLLCILHGLSGEEESPISLVNQTKSPIPRAAGSVNIISGNWVDQSAHHATSGPDPYVVAHSYISSSLEEGTLADGWDFFHPSDLEVFQPKGIYYNRKNLEGCPSIPKMACHRKGDGSPANVPPPTWIDNEATLYYRDAGGATILFTGTGMATGFYPKLKNTGYLLVSSIDNPVRRDVKRTHVFWESASDHWVVKLGDGTRRIYARADKHKYRLRPDQKSYYKRSYHIKEEVLPSGNRRQYHYDADKELSSIRTLSSDKRYVLHSVAFHRKSDEVKVTTSEGITTHFSLKKLHDRETAYVVEKITRPGKARLSYAYSDKSSHHERRVDARRYSTGRHEEAKFYHEGKNDVGKAVVKIASKKQKKFLENRVREVWTKAFATQSLSVSHAFTYKQQARHSSAKVHESDGASTIYFWDTTYRPNWIGLRDPEGELLQAEHFVWDAGNGRLQSRTVLDERKNPLIQRQFFYDKKGNVIKESLRGSFTGRPHKPFTLGSDKSPHGGELFTWEATYSDDGRSLKTSERDALGNWTFYEYEPSRQLLTARFTCDKEHIIKREFFTYDSSGICIEDIVDDGSSRHKTHCTDVTRRTIHRMTPRHKTPFFGFPDEERWLVYTKAYGEKLLKVERTTRDGQGRAIAKELIDAFGVVQKRWTYAYDTCHRVIKSCDPTGRVERFSYDDAGRIVTKRTPEATYTFSYDLLDCVIEEKKTFPDGTSESVCRQYNLSGRTVTEIDGRGRETTTVRDLAGRLVLTTFPALGTDSGTVRPQMRMGYSGNTERCVSTTGAVTKVVRSGTGKPLVTTNPFGAKTYCYYDGRGRLVEQKEASGLTTLYEYDAFDRPTKVEQLSDGHSFSVITKRYRGFDLVEERHPTKVFHYKYDRFGRQAQTRVTDLVTQETVTTRTHYDSLHRPIRIFHDDLGTEERLTYDAADRVIEKRVVGADGSLLSVATKVYDTAGRVVEEGVGRAGTIARTKTTYGAYGLLSVVTLPDGTMTKVTYNPLYRWKDGHIYLRKVTTDARGVVAEELIDSNDQVRFGIVRDPFGAVISSRTVFFSVLGKPVLIEDQAIASERPTEVIKTRLEYDIAGQPIACTLAYGTPDAATWRYRYDKEGHKVEEIKPSGVSLASAYDAKGRLSSFTSSDGSISWNYQYNVQGLPEVIVNSVSQSTTRRSYNGLGVMTSETLETDLTLSYDVQATGLLSSITYPDTSQATYAYASGQLSSIARNGVTYQVTSRDMSGVITSASLPAAAGQLLQSIDVMGRGTSVQHAAFSEERTVFDPVGCCLERVIDGKHEVFTYDFLCQLTNDNGRTATYDSLFRRLETEGKEASHNARHQILSQGDIQYQYDIDGRRESDDRFRYWYDACDRLTAVEDETTRYEYAYDAFHRRISSTTFVKEEGGNTLVSKERFLWQGDCEIGSVDDQGRTASLRVLGEGRGGELGAAVLFEVAGEMYIPIHDISGHVRACLNMQGEVVEKLFYTAVGVESRTANITPWTFSSKRQDEGTGFLYFGRRFYDPSTATWLTQDPLGMSAGPNLYAYVKNNPLMSCDLFGLIDQSNDRGFWGGMWDRCCDFFSGLFGGWCESGSSSESSVEAPASQSREPPEGTRTVLLRSNLDVIQSQKYSDRLVIYPFKDVKDFLKAFNGQDLEEGVAVSVRGVGVTLEEALASCQKMMDNNRALVAVVLLYNATNGLPNDLIEAFLNTLGFEMTVGKVLRGLFCDFLSECSRNNISFTANIICHSQGVAITRNLLQSEQFRENVIYGNFIKDCLNLGGPVLVPGCQNCIALGDPVSLMALINLPALITSVWNGELSVVCPSTIEFPHNYAGSAYQGTIDKFMKQGR